MGTVELMKHAIASTDLCRSALEQALQVCADNESLKKELETIRIINEQVTKENISVKEDMSTLKRISKPKVKQLQMKVKQLQLENRRYRNAEARNRRNRRTPSSGNRHTPPSGEVHTPPSDESHAPPSGKRHTPPLGKEHTPSSSPLHNHETTVSLFPSPSSTSPIVISEDSSPALMSQGFLGGVAIPKGRRLLQLANSPSKKSRVRYLETRPIQEGEGHRPIQEGEGHSRKHTNAITHLAAVALDHTPKVAGTCDVTHLGMTSLPMVACDASTKVAQSCDQTCDVTHLACDMLEDSSALPVINFKDGLQPGEESGHMIPGEESGHMIPGEGSGHMIPGECSSSSDVMSPSLFTCKHTSYKPDFPSLGTKDKDNMASTFIMPPVELTSSSVGLDMSPIHPLGMPISDSQCSLDTCETQPPSPKLDSSRDNKPFNPEQGSHIEYLNTTGLSSDRQTDPPSIKMESNLDTRRDKKRGRRRGRGLKQTTLTQVLPNGSLGLTTPTIVAITPGVRPMAAILSDPLFLRTGERSWEAEDHEEVILRVGPHDEVTMQEAGPRDEVTMQEAGPRDEVTMQEAGPRDEVTPYKRQRCLTGGGVQGEELCDHEEGPQGEELCDHEEEGSQGEELLEAQEEEAEQTLIESEDEKENVYDEYARKLAREAGLPTYKFVVPIRKKSDRDRLDAKACPDCKKWFADGDGIHRDTREHLKQVCRHKHLYLPPDTDPRLWDISFPNTEECERIMANKRV